MLFRCLHNSGSHLLLSIAKASLVLTLASLVLIFLNQPTRPSEPLQARSSSQWSLGYWTVWGDPSVPVSDIDWGALTHVIHHAALLNADGTLDVETLRVSTNAPALISAAHAAGVKALLCIAQSSRTGQLANLEQAVVKNRANLRDNIIKLVNTYGYDGVDINWEPFDPRTNGGAMRSFARDLRERLQGKILTTAAIVADYEYWGTAHTPFDRVNVMTYDLTGTWNPYSWHNAALYDRGGRIWSVDRAVKQFTASGVPAAKLGIGIPFYGWEWSRAQITGPQQSWTAAPCLRQISYQKIACRITFRNYKWESFCQVPYLSINTGSSANHQFITYDNEQSAAAKVNYAKAKHLGGWIIWELSGDYFPSHTPNHPLLAAVKNAMLSNSPVTNTPLADLKQLFTLSTTCW
jgi:chitinase